MEPNTAVSGLLCMKVLLGQCRGNTNLNAVLSKETVEKYVKDPGQTLFALAENFDLGPEMVDPRDAEGCRERTGAALLKMKNNNWVLVLRTDHFAQEAVACLDPSVNNGGKPIAYKTKELLERTDGNIIYFVRLREVDSEAQSGVFCLTTIARHHQVRMDMRQVMHDYAIGADEPNLPTLIDIAQSYGFKTGRKKLNWEKMLNMGQAFPFIGVKKNNKYLVVAGVKRMSQEEPPTLAVIDPAHPGDHGSPFSFMTEAQFNETMSDQFVLLKRTYRLSDEAQPFGLRWFIPEFLKLKNIFIQIALTVCMITALSLVVPLFFQIVVDKVLVNQAYNTLNVIGIGIFFAILFNGFLEYVRNYFLLFATNKIDIATAMKTFRHMMRLPIDFFEKIPAGVLLKHMQQTEKIRGFLSGNLFFTLLDIFALCIFIPFLLFYSVSLTLIVLGFSALMALVIATLIKPFQTRLNELYQAEGKRQSMLVESIHGIRTVKSLALEPVEEKHWDDTTAYAIKSYFRVGKISMTAKSISQVLEMLMTVAIIWAGALMVFEGNLTVGALIAFQMLAGRVTGPLVRMVGLIHEYQQIALSVKMLGVVMNTPEEPAGGGIRNRFKGEVSFEGIGFQYRPDLPQVIKNFSLKIPAGSTIGIVGRSGSGKSTLTKLLQGMYNVQQGVVKIDGVDIREIDKSHLRSSIGVVLQDNYFFSGSIRDNISMTKRNAALEEIIYAAKLAGADEFIQKTTRGYDCMLEENAVNLSGGQRQRLAIARALLTNPPILIFDEATSALDPESEQLIRDNLKAIAKDRTVIIVSHRLSIISGADQILTLENGEMTSLGTHKELLAQPGVYRNFWRQQMEVED